jgi:hypothetical protein
VEAAATMRRSRVPNLSSQQETDQMPFDQMQVRDYAVVIHAGNDEWTWQVMDFDARVAAQGEAPDRESAWRSGMFAAGAVGAFARIGRRV